MPRLRAEEFGATSIASPCIVRALTDSGRSHVAKLGHTWPHVLAVGELLLFPGGGRTARYAGTLNRHVAEQDQNQDSDEYPLEGHLSLHEVLFHPLTVSFERPRLLGCSTLRQHGDCIQLTERRQRANLRHNLTQSLTTGRGIHRRRISHQGSLLQRADDVATSPHLVSLHKNLRCRPGGRRRCGLRRNLGCGGDWFGLERLHESKHLLLRLILCTRPTPRLRQKGRRGNNVRQEQKEDDQCEENEPLPHLLVGTRNFLGDNTVKHDAAK